MPRRREIVEALAYPAQPQTNGVLVTIGRLYYGPGRYDYGRLKMPEGDSFGAWLKNFFFPVWELQHILFVADRWTFYRTLKHFIFIPLFFLPMYIQSKWNVAAWKEYKAAHSG